LSPSAEPATTLAPSDNSLKYHTYFEAGAVGTAYAMQKVEKEIKAKNGS
jgi:hypothetical protein